MTRTLLLSLALCAAAGCGRGPEARGPRLPRGLMDRPIAEVALPDPSADPVLSALGASGEVWFLDKLFQPWNVFPTTPPDETPQRWRGVPTMPVSGPGFLARIEDLTGPGARHEGRELEAPMKPGTVAPGEVLVDPTGVHLATPSRQAKPPGFRPCYPTSASALSERLGVIATLPGERPPSRHETFDGEARRAVRTMAGSALSWDLAPSDARRPLEFGFARDRWSLRPVAQPEGAAMLEVNEQSDAALHFAIAWSAEGRPRQTLWETTLTAEQADAVHEASIPMLPDHANGARLTFEVRATETGASGAGRAYWLDPAFAARPTKRPRPNVLLVVLDTLRADRLGCYGYERATSPRIDAIARDGVLFERAWSAAPWTLPSHASLFSSLHAVEHGVFDASVRLPEEAETIAEVLFNAGYDTAAFTEAGYVRPELGLAQGFQRFRCALAEVDETFDGAADWIEEQERPFFAFVHTYKVHTPYDPAGAARELLVRPYDGPLPENARVDDVPAAHKAHDYTAEDARYLSDLYDAEIRELDDAFGDFMDRLRRSGALENTLVVITADHGEEFAEHGQFNHSNSLYEEQLRVPLILLPPSPDAFASLSGEVPAMAVDIAPTIAQVADAPVPPGWSGRSLLEPRGGGDEDPSRWVLYRPSGSQEMTYALERRGVKLMWYPEDLRPEDTNPSTTIFRLESDPGEQAGVSSLEWTVEGTAEALKALRQAHPRRWQGSGASSSPELRAQLAELGYATGND
ncbi:MAG: sulfatase [Planctomycetota bacterium]|nr:sulfatase [Planctomycetota bacterium]